VALHERLDSVAQLSRRDRALGAGLAVALVVVTIAVALGAFSRLDQYSLDHLMPWLVPRSTSDDNGFGGLWLPFRAHGTVGLKLLELFTYPCSVLVSGLVVLTAAIVFRPRLGSVAALAPAAAWVVGNAIEVLLKHTIVKPAVFGSAGAVRIHVSTFDTSYASGHMMRGLIVAWTLTLLWRRASPWVWIWAALIGPVLVLVSAHTPSDVVGGALVGVLVIVPANAVVRQAHLERALAA
jgi:membrane-associated phospholipid phosphatase